MEKVTRSKTFFIEEDAKLFNSKKNAFLKTVAKEDIISVNENVVVIDNKPVFFASIVFSKAIKAE